VEGGRVGASEGGTGAALNDFNVLLYHNSLSFSYLLGGIADHSWSLAVDDSLSAIAFIQMVGRWCSITLLISRLLRLEV
jgi:hypothetical protein